MTIFSINRDDIRSLNYVIQHGFIVVQLLTQLVKIADLQIGAEADIAGHRL